MLRTVPLASQVGGHLGVHTTEDGSLIIKPALPLELQFYQSALVDSSFLPLRPFIPLCYGTLRLEGKLDTENANDGNITISKIEGLPAERRDEYILPLPLATVRLTA
jgi:1D-myo-inositol-tetrakisphosphate 5-kinase/inositol-polyphosphate multikinase